MPPSLNQSAEEFAREINDILAPLNEYNQKVKNNTSSINRPLTSAEIERILFWKEMALKERLKADKYAQER